MTKKRRTSQRGKLKRMNSRKVSYKRKGKQITRKYKGRKMRGGNGGQQGSRSRSPLPRARARRAATVRRKNFIRKSTPEGRWAEKGLEGDSGAVLFNPEHVGVHASDLGSPPSAATSTAPAPMTALERLNSVRDKLIEVFREFDKDEKNEVSHEEFDVALELLGINIRETPFAEIVEKTKDDSNRVNYIAFLDNVRELV
tara:strand:+ start:277 stop:873 length:597 start_codon:yes stop_codon:yes gene_type:complete